MASSSSFRIPPAAMVALFLTLFLSSALLPLVHTKTVELTNFEFENRVLPDNTVVVSAAPSGNVSISHSEFGSIRVVTNVLRETIETNSTVLGSVVGLVNTLRDDSGLYLTFNFVYASQDYNGTIGVQGQLNASGDGELVVTGGTGDFRLAQGWVTTTLVSSSDLANIVFKNVVHLEYD